MPESDDKSTGRTSGSDLQSPGPNSGPVKSGNSWILWTILVLVVVGVAYYYLHSRSSAKKANASGAAGAQGGGAGGAGGRRGLTGPVPVTVATATKGNIGVYQDAIGTVTPVYTDQITAQVTGVLTAVNYREGQFVRKGDPLIEIDPRPFEATLLEAQGTLERDQNVLAQAQMDLDRYRKAWAANGINKQLLDDQEKIVLQDQGTVKIDQGTVQYDQVQLSYCHIAAPISGQIGFRLVDPGNLVQASASTPLLVITQMQPTTVIFTLAEDNLGAVQARMRQLHQLPVEAWDRNSTHKLAEGKLLTINNQIDTTTGTVKLRATFDNRDNALFPNQFVNSRLLVNTQNGVTLVPTAAVQHNGEAAFVYVIDTTKNVASVRNVKTGVTDAGVVAVQGIEPGTIVATSSFDKLQAGSKIIVSKVPLADNQTEGNTP